MQTILDAIEKLSRKLDAVEKHARRSTEVNELYSALAKAQSEYKVAGTGRTGQWKNKYADLNSLITASRPALTKNGLAVKFDIVINDDGQSILNTILSHSSGQFETTQIRILPEKSDIQSFGKQLAYLQRYTYKLVTGVSMSNDAEDDDTGGIPEEEDTKITPDFLRKEPEQKSFDVITKYQLTEIQHELDGFSELAEKILEKMNLRSFADLPQSKCEGVLKRIRELKQIEGK
jgi:hypothetical protein